MRWSGVPNLHGSVVPRRATSLFPSGKTLHTVCYLTGGLLPALPAPPPALTTSSKKRCVTHQERWETRGHAHEHARKLLHSFLHSFPVMEGSCASRPQGDSSANLLFGKSGGCGPVFHFVNQWENITQSSKPNRKSDFSRFIRRSSLSGTELQVLGSREEAGK